MNKFILAIALIASQSEGIADASFKSKSFLGNGMQPEVVAKTLAHVEDEWKAQAAVFADCDSTSGLPGASLVNCADAPTSFSKSCTTVVNAIIQGSGGDKDVTKEYMEDVCTQKSITGWHQVQCNTLSLAVRKAMTSDKYQNRESFGTAKLCKTLWGGKLAEQKERVAKEAAEREAEEKKANEDAAVEQKNELEEQLDQVSAKKAEDAAHKQEEAKAKAAEAKAQAAESAAHVAKKKAEAEASAAAAKTKMAEAKVAEAKVTEATVAAKAAKLAVEDKTVAAASQPAKPVVAAAAAAAAPKDSPKTVAAKPVAVEPKAASAPVAKKA